MALFGQVELVLDKKHKFTVSTGQASLLLKVAEHDNSKISELEFDADVIATLSEPLVACGLLIRKDDTLSIGQPASTAANTLLTVNQYL
jgi:hypothetical protein